MAEHGEPRVRRSSSIAVWAVVVSLASAAPAAGTVPWSELRFEASKLFMSAEAVVRVAADDGESLADPPPPERAVGSTGDVVRVEVRSDLPLDRHELTISWLDLTSGRALQAEKLVSGRKNYWKRKRFTVTGYHQWRAEPGPGEKPSAGPEGWSGTSESSAELVREDDRRPVADPYSLLYLIAASDLGREGARATIHLPSDGDLVTLELVSGGLESKRVDFADERDGQVSRTERAILRRVRATARRSDGGEDGDVETGLLGLRGALDLLVLEDGTPVEISGRSKGIGRITVHLTHRVLSR